MTFPLDDLSPAALETLADLIEERLDNPDSGYLPATWHETQARQNAARELQRAMTQEEPRWWPAGDPTAGIGPRTLH
jgi:hypothetical protein